MLHIEGQFGYTFRNCRFNKISIENGDQINFKDISIVFQDCFIKDIAVKSLTSENISLIFLSGCASGKLKSSKLSSVSFNNTLIRDHFILTDVPKIEITYTEENLFADRWHKFLMQNGLTRKTLLKYFQKFYIYNPQKVYYASNEINASKKKYYRDPAALGSELKTRLTLQEKQSLYISLSFYLDQSKEVDIRIKDSYLRAVSFNNAAKGSITVEQTQIDSLYLHNFSITGKLIFYKLSPFSNSVKDHKIEVHQCNLNAVWFEKAAFRKYEPVSFYRTNFDGCQFIACDFPEKPADYEKFMALANVHYKNVQPENFYKDQYEIFIQIKSILEKSGNFHEALKLNAMANESLRKTDDINLWDKRILAVNSFSNYHSLSLKRAFWGFMVSSIVLYIAYLVSIDRIFTNEKPDWSLFGYYFSFIDLTHKIDFMVDKDKFTAGSLTIDFIGKLCIGFYIYQFIAAFRKYGKTK